MTIICNIDGKDVHSKNYPKLMSARNGRIVLMVQRGHGVELQDRTDGNEGMPSGACRFSTSWAMDHFTDYPLPITIRNQ